MRSAISFIIASCFWGCFSFGGKKALRVAPYEKVHQTPWWENRVTEDLFVSGRYVRTFENSGNVVKYFPKGMNMKGFLKMPDRFEATFFSGADLRVRKYPITIDWSMGGEFNHVPNLPAAGPDMFVPIEFLGQSFSVIDSVINRDPSHFYGAVLNPAMLYKNMEIISVRTPDGSHREYDHYICFDDDECFGKYR